MQTGTLSVVANPPKADEATAVVASASEATPRVQAGDRHVATAPRDDMLKQRIIASATNAHLHEAARFLAALPPEKLTAVIRASSSWREVLRRKGFGEWEKQLAASGQKPTSRQRLFLVSAALAGSEKDLAATAAQITGSSAGLSSAASRGIPSVLGPAGAARVAPTVQNLLVR